MSKSDPMYLLHVEVDFGLKKVTYPATHFTSRLLPDGRGVSTFADLEGRAGNFLVNYSQAAVALQSLRKQALELAEFCDKSLERLNATELRRNREMEVLRHVPQCEFCNLKLMPADVKAGHCAACKPEAANA